MQFYVSEEERNMIFAKMEQLGTENMSAYLRKMAIDGQVIKLDLPELKEIRFLLRRTSDNLNQLTKRANANGRIYNEDLADIQVRLDTIWDAANLLLQELAKLG